MTLQESQMSLFEESEVWTLSVEDFRARLSQYWAFDKAQEVNSNSQLYKQAGNSVTVNVIAAIAKELK